MDGKGHSGELFEVNEKLSLDSVKEVNIVIK